MNTISSNSSNKTVDNQEAQDTHKVIEREYSLSNVTATETKKLVSDFILNPPVRKKKETVIDRLKKEDLNIEFS